MANRVQHKVALVTGAASGIGKATAHLLAQEGATMVIIADIDDKQGQEVAKQIGANAVFHHLDVSKEEQWIKITDDIIKQFGKLDILFNNAGTSGLTKDFGIQNPEYCSLDDWQRIHAINLDSVFLGCKHGIRVMKHHGNASIINMSSRSGLVGVPNTCAYASSKAAIKNHTKSVALYCAEKNYGIRCNAVYPAAILTPLWDPIIGTNSEREKRIAAIANEIPLKRMGLPHEVANAVLYFASDESLFVTGAELVIDGGILAGSSASASKK